METEVSLPHSQEIVSFSYPAPEQSSLFSHPISWRSILILSPYLRLGLPGNLFPSGIPTKTLYTPLLSSPPYVLPAPSISFFSIGSTEQCLVKSTVHWAFHYVVFCTPLLPRPVEFQKGYLSTRIPIRSVTARVSAHCDRHLYLWKAYTELQYFLLFVSTWKFLP